MKIVIAATPKSSKQARIDALRKQVWGIRQQIAKLRNGDPTMNRDKIKALLAKRKKLQQQMDHDFGLDK